MATSEDHDQSPAQTVPPSSQEAGVEPSGYKGENPSTAGPGQTGIRSNTPENNLGRINPSAPEDSNTTPGSGAEK